MRGTDLELTRTIGRTVGTSLFWLVSCSTLVGPLQPLWFVHRYTREYNWCFEHRLLVTLLIRYPNGFFLPEGERETTSLRDLLRIHSDHTGEGSADLSVDPCELPDVPLSQLAVAGFIRFWVRGIFARVLA